MFEISVIIPLYNVEQYIGRCLQSLVNQTFQSFEVIIVNDASTDNSVAVISEYIQHFKRCTVLTHEVNKGLMYARYTGYKNAKGRYYCFLDSDDFLPNDSLLQLYEAITKGCFDMVKGAFTIVDEHNKEKEMYVPTIISGNNGDSLITDILRDNIMHNIWGAIYHHSIFDNYEYITFENQTNSEDLLLLLQICKNIKSYSTISQSIYYYYENTASSSRKRFGNKSLEQYLNALRFVHKDNTLDINERDYYVTKYIGSLLYNNYDIKKIQEYFDGETYSYFSSADVLFRLHGFSMGVILWALYNISIFRMLTYSTRHIINKFR